MKLSISLLAMVHMANAANEKAPLSHIVTIGTRPYYLIDQMKPSELKDKLGEKLFSFNFCVGTDFAFITNSHLGRHIL